MDVNNVVGVDLGGTKVTAAAVQSEQVLNKETLLISAHKNEQSVINEVISVIEKVINPGTQAIGIGVPSVVDVVTGVVYDVQNIPSWKKVPLKQLLEAHFSIPVYIDNDANCFTAGVYKLRLDKSLTNLVGLIIGTGTAAGIVVKGQMHHGHNCGAGEFGMLPYLEHNYEWYCSGQYFNHRHNLSGEQLYQRAKNNDPKALEIFLEFGSHIGQLVSVILYTVDPEIIVFGGSVGNSYPFFKGAMWKVLEDFAYRNTVNRLQIEVNSNGQIALLGAAALVPENL